VGTHVTFALPAHRAHDAADYPPEDQDRATVRVTKA